jgi:DNA-binding MarR family transcriptional regulator
MIHLRKIVHVTRTIVPGPSESAHPIAKADPTERIITDFRVTVTQLKCAMSERLLRLGVSMAQVNILYTLHRSGEMPMSRLAELLNVSLSNATGLIDRLEERGYLERTRVPEDRRVVIVRLTAGGVQLIDQQDAMTDGLLRTVLGRLKPGQLLTIAQATADLRAAVEATTAPIPDRHPFSTPAPRSPSTMRGTEDPSGATRPAHHLATTSRRD